MRRTCAVVAALAALAVGLAMRNEAGFTVEDLRHETGPPQVDAIFAKEDQRWNTKRNGIPVGELAELLTNGGKPWRPLPDFLDHSFSEYTMLCSHNSYLYGRQSNHLGAYTASTSTSVSTMGLLLNSGYRCLELDVWVRRGALVVGHLAASLPPGNMTNYLPLGSFLTAIAEWLNADEQRQAGIRTPLVISVENRVGEPTAENNMAQAFSVAFGSRIVRPSEFLAGTALRSLAASSRRIILKSKLGPSFAPQWMDLVAMRNSGEIEKIGKLPGQAGYGRILSSKSIGVGGLGTHRIDTDKKNGKLGTTGKNIKAHLDKGILVRTFPFALNYHSTNYHPEGVFAIVSDTGMVAQMVCVNFQGACCQTGSLCTKIRNERLDRRYGPYYQCDCNREGAWQLELLFNQLGNDGYIHWPTLSPTEQRLMQNWVSWLGYEYKVKWWQGNCLSGAPPAEWNASLTVDME